ncbi:MAG: oligopeptide/dipeptide ABC transporter ATP-binding protein, partial [Anaerolineae bacterium]
ADGLFVQPKHPYTNALLATLPHHGRAEGKLPVIDGLVPPPSSWPSGCRFHPRCAFAVDTCQTQGVKLVTSGQDRLSRCLRLDEIDLKAIYIDESNNR